MAEITLAYRGHLKEGPPMYAKAGCRAALKTENFGNGVGLLHLNRYGRKLQVLKSDTRIVRGTCGAMIA